MNALVKLGYNLKANGLLYALNAFVQLLLYLFPIGEKRGEIAAYFWHNPVAGFFGAFVMLVEGMLFEINVTCAVLRNQILK